MEHILPVIDTAVLQEKANQFAMQGTIESIKEFYTGWNSPYRKAIDEVLKKQEIGFGITLPDIVALINEGLSREVDELANAAIAKTFVPLVKQFLVRVDKEIMFSSILKEFIECTEEDYNSYELTIKEDERFGWLSIEVSCDDHIYSFTLHLDSATKGEKPKKYHLLSLPHEFSSKDRYGDKMTLHIEGAKLEMPFSRDVLRDKFNLYLSRLVLSDSRITMDCNEFERDMFPEKCHCH